MFYFFTPYPKFRPSGQNFGKRIFTRSILLVLRNKIYFCHPVGYFRHPAAPALIWVFSSRTSQKPPERPFWPILAVFAHFCTVFTEVSGFIRSVRFRLKCPISIESGHLPVFTPKNSKFEPFSVKKTIPFLILIYIQRALALCLVCIFSKIGKFCLFQAPNYGLRNSFKSRFKKVDIEVCFGVSKTKSVAFEF